VQAAQRMVTRELGAFVEVELAGDVVAKTNAKFDSRREPTWNEAFFLDVCHDARDIKLRVRVLDALLCRLALLIHCSMSLLDHILFRARVCDSFTLVRDTSLLLAKTACNSLWLSKTACVKVNS
jgi:C2 domain